MDRQRVAKRLVSLAEELSGNGREAGFRAPVKGAAAQVLAQAVQDVVSKELGTRVAASDIEAYQVSEQGGILSVWVTVPRGTVESELVVDLKAMQAY